MEVPGPTPVESRQLSSAHFHQSFFILAEYAASRFHRYRRLWNRRSIVATVVHKAADVFIHKAPGFVVEIEKHNCVANQIFVQSAERIDTSPEFRVFVEFADFADKMGINLGLIQKIRDGFRKRFGKKILQVEDGVNVGFDLSFPQAPLHIDKLLLEFITRLAAQYFEQFSGDSIDAAQVFLTGF